MLNDPLISFFNRLKILLTLVLLGPVLGIDNLSKVSIYHKWGPKDVVDFTTLH